MWLHDNDNTIIINAVFQAYWSGVTVYMQQKREKYRLLNKVSVETYKRKHLLASSLPQTR